MAAMTSGDYDRLYAVADILRHLRDARWRLAMMVEAGDPWDPDRLDKVHAAIESVQETFRDLEVISRPADPPLIESDPG